MIEIKNISKAYTLGKQTFQAIKEISLTIRQNITMGLVGESGCGKSTLGKIIVNQEIPSSGQVFFKEQDIHAISRNEMQHLRQQIQIILQDPYSALNPRMSIEQIVGEGIDIHQIAKGNERRKIIIQLLSQMGLDDTILSRYPREFSGGQRQRICIARALAVNPSFVVCDEPVSALDACTQDQVVSLLQQLKKERELTYLFISHDLNVVKQIADEICVMYFGQIVEQAPTNQLFSMPTHPYTQALLAAIPIADPKTERVRIPTVINSSPPSRLNPPKGCPYYSQCPKALPICQNTPPPVKLLAPGHTVRCHLSDISCGIME